MSSTDKNDHLLKAILLGPPGSGKGTQAQGLSDAYRVPSISTGDLLRSGVSTGTELGLKAEQYMKEGQLVPDQLIMDMMRERFTEADCQQGYLLDGFPRTVAQADGLHDINAHIHVVLLFQLDDESILNRLGGRWTHPASGRVYHEINHPPRRSGIDDETGEPLVQRPDDKRETILRRLEVFRKQTEPLIAYYQKYADEGEVTFITVDCSQDVATVRKHIMSTLSHSGFIPVNTR